MPVIRCTIDIIMVSIGRYTDRCGDRGLGCGVGPGRVCASAMLRSSPCLSTLAERSATRPWHRSARVAKRLSSGPARRWGYRDRCRVATYCIGVASTQRAGTIPARPLKILHWRRIGFAARETAMAARLVGAARPLLSGTSQSTESDMAVPKRKTSPMKRGFRRSADALAQPTYVEDKDFGRTAPPAPCRSEERHVSWSYGAEAQDRRRRRRVTLAT